MNQSYASVNAPYTTLTRTRCSKCNCTKIKHACYFRVFCVSWIYIGCGMRVVYAECINCLYSMFLPVLHTSDTSSLWLQSVSPHGLPLHSAKAVSVPVHARSSSHIGPVPARSTDTHVLADANPSCLHATMASFMSKLSSQIVPHWPLYAISSRPLSSSP